MARPVVDFPQPLSPTIPRVSPFRMEKVTSSTAFTSPIFFPNTPPRIGKNFFRCSTSRSGCGWVTIRFLLLIHMEPTPAVLSISYRKQTRLFRPADIHRVLTAGCKPAARRHLLRVGNVARDRVQPFGALAQARHRLEQTLGIGMTGLVEQRIHIRLLYHLAGVHA